MDEAHVVDAATNLIGVLRRPDIQADQAQTAVLLYNAGFLHHVGPNRINTTLARKLSGSGFVSLRFDFSGLGDSAALEDIADNSELVTKSAASAMDFVEAQTGINRFVLVGFCSGAVDALHIALNDSRVAGFLAVDGIGFRTLKFYWHHVLNHLIQRSFSVAHWQRKLRMAAASTRRMSLSKHGSAKAIVDDGDLTHTSKSEFKNILEKLASTGMRMRFVYTGGVSNYYNYQSQFDDTFQFAGLKSHISSLYYPDADHLFMLKAHRDQMVDDTCHWIESEFLQHPDESLPESGLTETTSNLIQLRSGLAQ